MLEIKCTKKPMPILRVFFFNGNGLSVNCPKALQKLFKPLAIYLEKLVSFFTDYIKVNNLFTELLAFSFCKIKTNTVQINLIKRKTTTNFKLEKAMLFKIMS